MAMRIIFFVLLLAPMLSFGQVTFTYGSGGIGSSNGTSLCASGAGARPNQLFLVHVSARVSSGSCPEPTLSCSGVTFTKLAEVFSEGTLRRTVFFVGYGSSSSGCICAAWPSTVHARLIWITEVGGAEIGNNGLDAIAQVKTASATSGDPALTLDAALSHTSNRTFFTTNLATTSPGTVEAGYTAVHAYANTLFAQPHAVIAAGSGDTDNSPSMSGGTSSNWGMIAVEIRAAGTLAAPSRRRIIQSN